MSSADSQNSNSVTPLVLFFGAVVGVVALLVALLVGVFTPIPLWLAVLLALILTAGVTLSRYRKADQICLDYLDVDDADEKTHARIFNLLESLSLSSGVPSPDLYISDDPSVNAMAVQQGSEAAAVVTTGAVANLDRLELEGLLAEVIIRIASGDARTATVGAAMVGLPFTSGPLAFLAPLARPVMKSALAADRELSGDVAAVGLTRFPPAITTVLALSDGQTVNDFSAPRTATGEGIAHLWVAPPAPYEGPYDVAIRIAALNEF